MERKETFRRNRRQCTISKLFSTEVQETGRTYVHDQAMLFGYILCFSLLCRG